MSDEVTKQPESDPKEEIKTSGGDEQVKSGLSPESEAYNRRQHSRDVKRAESAEAAVQEAKKESKAMREELDTLRSEKREFEITKRWDTIVSEMPEIGSAITDKAFKLAVKENPEATDDEILKDLIPSDVLDGMSKRRDEFKTPASDDTGGYNPAEDLDSVDKIIERMTADPWKVSRDEVDKVVQSAVHPNGNVKNPRVHEQLKFIVASNLDRLPDQYEHLLYSMNDYQNMM